MVRNKICYRYNSQYEIWKRFWFLLIEKTGNQNSNGEEELDEEEDDEEES